MNFKKPKRQVLDEAQRCAELRIRDTLRATMPYGSSLDQNSVINMLTYAVSAGIAEALQVVMENVYTDQEFEEDVGLRDKP